MTWTQPSLRAELLGLNADGPSVVAIGGGHGLAQVLQAVQGYAGKISAVVTVTDDGGSSGRLLDDSGLPPPGDLRKCLLALSPVPSVWGELFAYRFEDRDVAGHSLGNLILVALADLLGGFEPALRAAAVLLETQGEVHPAALESLQLSAIIDGVPVDGQAIIAKSRGTIDQLNVLPQSARANPAALQAIAGADQIILSPGSLFTSLLATLLVPGVAEGVDRARGKLVYVMNLVTQDAETLNFKGYDHIRAFYEHSGLRRAGTIVSHQGPLAVPDGLAAVTIDDDEAVALGWDLTKQDVSDHGAGWPQHDPIKLGGLLARLARG